MPPSKFSSINSAMRGSFHSFHAFMVLSTPCFRHLPNRHNSSLSLFLGRHGFGANLRNFCAGEHTGEGFSTTSDTSSAVGKLADGSSFLSPTSNVKHHPKFFAFA